MPARTQSTPHRALEPSTPMCPAVELRRPHSSPPAPAVTPPIPPDCGRIIAALVEVLSGRRALHQIGRHLNEHSLDIAARHLAAGLWRSAYLGSLRVQFPSERAIEAAVRIRLGDRSTACAVRLDFQRNRWICTDLQIAA